jgi:general secretion pathway protein E/type IV pilus assembly protein PilB
VQHNEEYVLKVLEEDGLVTRQQIDRARSLLNGEPGIVDVLINDGVVSDVDVSRTLAAQAQMDWIDISSMVIPPQIIIKSAGKTRAVSSDPGRFRRDRPGSGGR